MLQVEAAADMAEVGVVGGEDRLRDEYHQFVPGTDIGVADQRAALFLGLSCACVADHLAKHAEAFGRGGRHLASMADNEEGRVEVAALMGRRSVSLARRFG
ncbi:hypothetical protein [Azotobacter armeniacus]